ncbi:ATP-binding cassette domain-containing protein [Brevibacillus humidisoli]|uniref:ATP-binding cassette domain-containing protein n=1 Tax=Brevibacillus humidisoli TaxID=2895522 RepID=UPI001E521CE9|nr:ABC transporter ATP-binding protein [Brevibacillus humidisoli]UFJ41834.1 ATP-binding cassette domain-containing protein [Brevibacillus humidisoli]
MRQAVLQVRQLTISEHQGKKQHRLVHELNFSIRSGEMLALVGESGSGKSVTASAILGLLPNSLRVDGGEIVFQGEDILPWSEKRKRELRGKQIGSVFQDYQGSFTPFIKLGKQLVETIRAHRKVSVREAKRVALEWLDRVGLPAERAFHSYSFQLSGGQRQRAALAAAMMLKPSLLIADEPTSALDVLSGERVLNLLTTLQQQSGCAVLMISHDLRHVMKRADTIAVMKEGRIVETGPTESIRRRPSHPYTHMLLKARPYLSGAGSAHVWDWERAWDQETDEAEQLDVGRGGTE